jgi:hypothetical protein
MPPRATSKSAAAAKKDNTALDASNVDAGSRRSARTQRGASSAQNTQDMSTRASKRALESAATGAAADDAEPQDAVSAKKKTVVSSETAENQVTDTQEELQELQEPTPIPLAHHAPQQDVGREAAPDAEQDAQQEEEQEEEQLPAAAVPPAAQEILQEFEQEMEQQEEHEELEEQEAQVEQDVAPKNTREPFAVEDVPAKKPGAQELENVQEIVEDIILGGGHDNLPNYPKETQEHIHNE